MGTFCRRLLRSALPTTALIWLWVSAGNFAFAAGAIVYSGPCDLVAGGCAEAYSVNRAMTTKYHGPLFQLYNGHEILDVPQTSRRSADVSTWAAFCGEMITMPDGIATSSKCKISKIYGQVHQANTLVPSVFKPPYGVPDCAAGDRYVCAAAFAIESATGMPIIRTTDKSEYTVAGDAFGIGIKGGTSAKSVMYNGRAVPLQLYCCGVFGLTHKYNAGNVFGTDFMVALAYGRPTQSNLVLCGTKTAYCAGAEEENINDVADYGSSPVDNAVVAIVNDPSTVSVTGYLNGKMLFVHHPPALSAEFPNAYINTGTAVHLGGGGDLSVPAPALMREAFITNSPMSGNDQLAAFRNMTAFYRGLSFGPPR